MMAIDPFLGVLFSPKKKILREFNGNLIRYRINGWQEDVICRHYLWFPKKFDDGWHWFSWAYTRHTPNGFDWTTKWFSKDEFLVFKLSNDLEAVAHK